MQSLLTLFSLIKSSGNFYIEVKNQITRNRMCKSNELLEHNKQKKIENSINPIYINDCELVKHELNRICEIENLIKSINLHISKLWLVTKVSNDAYSIAKISKDFKTISFTVNDESTLSFLQQKNVDSEWENKDFIELPIPKINDLNIQLKPSFKNKLDELNNYINEYNNLVIRVKENIREINVFYIMANVEIGKKEISNPINIRIIQDVYENSSEGLDHIQLYLDLSKKIIILSEELRVQCPIESDMFSFHDQIISNGSVIYTFNKDFENFRNEFVETIKKLKFYYESNNVVRR